MPVREVMDGAERRWTVWDTYPESARRTNVMQGYEAGWLTFECEGEKRRLVPVPADWETAPEPQILDYLAGATAVRGTRPEGST